MHCTHMIVKYLDGSIDQFDESHTLDMIREHIQREKCGRNQIVHIINKSEEENDDKNDKIVYALISPQRQLTKDEQTKIYDGWVRHTSQDWFERFRNAVIDHQAVVAGGSLLSAFTGEEVNDFDVYIHHRYALSFTKQIRASLEMKPMWRNTYTAGTAYDKSFFRQNHILLRIPFHKKSTVIDVIIVENDIPLQQVVSNFDLTFCETWWDGRTVFANDPEGLRRREGWLKPAYHKRLFEDFNKFTINRIQKYKRRGWKVSYESYESYGSSVEDVNIANVDEDREKEEACVRMFIRYAYQLLMMRRHNQPLRYAYAMCSTPERFTYEELAKIYPPELNQAMACSMLRNRDYIPERYLETFHNMFRVSSAPVIPTRAQLREMLAPIRSQFLNKCAVPESVLNAGGFHEFENHDRDN